MLFELNFTGETSEEKNMYAAGLGTKAKQIFFFKYLRLLLKKYVKKTRDSISHIERTVNVLGEGPTKNNNNKCNYR